MAGVLTLSLTGAGSITPASMNLSTGDVTKLVDAYTKKLIVNGIPAPTAQQCFDFMAAQLRAFIINEVRNQQQADAAALTTGVVFT